MRVRLTSFLFLDVAFNSTITLRHVNTQGGYLHSHPHNYPTGSKQQQITLYPHIDGNNEWRIVPLLDPNADKSSLLVHPFGPFLPISIRPIIT
jgi:dolichyl-phosphate-mannose--protein O-mannosyl transferase